jgi:hypothetical protein
MHTVTLQRPADDLTPEQRVATYNALHATAERDVVTVSCYGACSSHETRTIQLADGRQTSEPRDLLPVLLPHSKAARHIRAAESHRRQEAFWLGGGVVAFGLGLALGFEMVGRDATGGQDWSTARYPVYAGVAALLVGGALMYYHRRRSMEETSAAYQTYNEGLAEMLDVCVLGLQVIPCEASPK